MDTNLNNGRVVKVHHRFSRSTSYAIFVLIKDQIANSVASWKRVAEAQELSLAQSLPKVTTSESIVLFNSLCKDALKNLPNRSTSGLVEQQHWFQRLRK